MANGPTDEQNDWVHQVCGINLKEYPVCTADDPPLTSTPESADGAIDRPQIVALWAASAYPADVWRSMTATEQSAVIVGEMQEMVERVASVDVPPVGEGGSRRSRRHTSR